MQSLCDESGRRLACLPDGTIGPADGSSSCILAVGGPGGNLLLEAQGGAFRFQETDPVTIVGVRSSPADDTSLHLHLAMSGEALRVSGSDRFRLLPTTQDGVLSRLPPSFIVDGNGLRLLFAQGGEPMVPVARALMPLLNAAEVRGQWAAVAGPEKAPYLALVRSHSQREFHHFGHFTRDILRHDSDVWGWSIGEKSYGAPMILEPSLGKLTIGRYCSLANPTIILGNHGVDRATTYPFMSFWIEWPGTTIAAGTDDHVGRNVTIGNDVWIGHQAIILPGATIGDGAVIGAGCIIGGTVPPYAICIGNPGKVLRYRFDEKTIARMLLLEWWHWPDAVVDRYLPKILGGDVSAFLDEAEREFMAP